MKPIDDRPKEATPPRTGLGIVWAVVLAFTVYGAEEIRDEVAKDERLAPLDRLLSPVEHAGQQVGISRVKGGLDRARQALNDPYLVLEAEVVDPIAAAPDAGVRAPDGDTHQVAPAKRRVLIIGASSIQFALGVELEKRFPSYEGVESKRFGQLATGLARPDFFDWPKKLDELARKWRPDLVVANFGGNCAQDIPVGDTMVKTGTTEWKALYGERVKELIRIARSHGADYVYLGMPNMRDPAFAKKMALVNEVQAKASAEEGALFVSTWEMTSTETGAYRKSVDYGGKRGLIRTSDGVHFKELGAAYVVDEVLRAVERRFVFASADRSLARVERHAFDGAGGRVEYVAFVPRGAGEQDRRPLLVLAAPAAWAAWPAYPHRELQRTAESHRVVVAVVEGVERLASIERELVKDAAAHLPVSDRVRVADSIDGWSSAIAELVR